MYSVEGKINFIKLVFNINGELMETRYLLKENMFDLSQFSN